MNNSICGEDVKGDHAGFPGGALDSDVPDDGDVNDDDDDDDDHDDVDDVDDDDEDHGDGDVPVMCCDVM